MPLFGSKSTPTAPPPAPPERRRSLFSSLRPESKHSADAAKGPVVDDRRKSSLNGGTVAATPADQVPAERGSALHEAREGVLQAQAHEKAAELKVKEAEAALRQAKLAVKHAIARVEAADRHTKAEVKRLQAQQKEVAGLRKTTDGMGHTKHTL